MRKEDKYIVTTASIFVNFLFLCCGKPLLPQTSLSTMIE